MDPNAKMAFGLAKVVFNVGPITAMVLLGP